MGQKDLPHGRISCEVVHLVLLQGDEVRVMNKTIHLVKENAVRVVGCSPTISELLHRLCFCRSPIRNSKERPCFPHSVHSFPGLINPRIRLFYPVVFVAKFVA